MFLDSILISGAVSEENLEDLEYFKKTFLRSFENQHRGRLKMLEKSRRRDSNS